MRHGWTFTQMGSHHAKALSSALILAIVYTETDAMRKQDTGGVIHVQKILKRNKYQFLVSLIPVVIVGIMAPLRSYIMQLLIDSADYRELLKMCLIAVVFSVGVFAFEWISKKSQAMGVLDSLL